MKKLLSIAVASAIAATIPLSGQNSDGLDAKALKVGDRVVASGPESQGMISAETVKLGAAPAAAAKK